MDERPQEQMGARSSTDLMTDTAPSASFVVPLKGLTSERICRATRLRGESYVCCWWKINRQSGYFYEDLLSAEYDVKFAMNGEEALAAVRRQRPDLILSDVLTPLLDGIGLACRLRSDVRTASVPIILMTASKVRDLPTRGLEAGANEFLLKPFGPLDLLAHLRCHWQMSDFPNHLDLAR